MRKERGGSAPARLLAALLTCAVLLMAAGYAQTAQNYALTIHCAADSTALQGVSFSVYKVGSLVEGNVYEKAGAFAGYDYELNALDSEGWRELAMTLATYAQRDSIAPDASGKTNAQGDVKIEGLGAGLYLYVGAVHVQSGYQYEFETGIVRLPGEGQKDVLVTPKMQREKAGPVDIAVRKDWADKGHEESRPKSVIVQLLRDGKVFETVELNADNSWRYEWIALEGGYEWRVAEKNAPGAYQDTYRRDGNTFIVINTYKTPGTPSRDNKLPQTGLLWWPVPLLAGAGMLLCFAGWRKERNEEVR